MRRSGPGREVACASPRLTTGVTDRVIGHDRGSALDTTLATTVDTSLDVVLDHVPDHVLNHVPDHVLNHVPDHVPVLASDSSPDASGDVQAAARRPGSRASGT